MISRVEVFKTSEARIDEGGVGGTVILHTRRPLDMDALSGFLSAEGTDSDTTRRVDPQVSGLLSWKNRSETYGLLVGATYQKRESRTMEATTESWRWWPNNSSVATDVNHKPYPAFDQISYWFEDAVVDQSGKQYTGYWAPQSVNATVVDQERVRTGFQVTGQWKPGNDMTLTANYFRFNLENDQVRNTLKVPEWGYYNGLFQRQSPEHVGLLGRRSLHAVLAGYPAKHPQRAGADRSQLHRFVLHPFEYRPDLFPTRLYQTLRRRNLDCQFRRKVSVRLGASRDRQYLLVFGSDDPDAVPER